MTFRGEINFLGDQSRSPYANYTVEPGGVSAHWVRITPDSACTATAYLTYT